jgi:putative ABC transport system ATP-binding protein
MIELSHVWRVFQVGDQQVQALRDLTLNIQSGEYISIMGPSGSGKSTLLNIIGLLDRPSAGSYVLDGQDITTLNDEQQAEVRRNKIGFVFQFFHLVQRMTAAQNVELPLVLAGVAQRSRKELVSRRLTGFGMAPRAHHRPDQLSGGERQRVAIARATIMGPRVLLADEPTGNLDQATGKDVIALLERLNAGGMTLIVVTHDADLGWRARRRIRMVDGRIESDTSAGAVA